MTVPTVFITRMHIALTRETAMLRLGTPSGPIGGDQVGHEETLRLVLSHQTLRQVAAMLSKQVAELDALAGRAASPRPAPTEKRSISADEEDDAPQNRTLQ